MFLTFLNYSETVFWAGMDKKWFKASFETYVLGGGANLSNKSHKSMRTLIKCPEIAIKFDRKCKNAKHIGFITNILQTQE